MFFLHFMPHYFLLQNILYFLLHRCLGHFICGSLAQLVAGGACDTKVIVYASSNSQFVSDKLLTCNITSAIKGWSPPFPCCPLNQLYNNLIM